MPWHSLTLGFALLLAPAAAAAQDTPQTPNTRELEAAASAQADLIRAAATKLPLVNVAAAEWGRNCPNPADPTGRLDSTCAVQRAKLFAEANGIPGGGYPTLYFPHGRYLLAGQGFTPALSFTRAIGMVGDGSAATVLVNTSHTAGLVAWYKANDCSGLPGTCVFAVRGLSFAGLGHTTMGGLLELDSTSFGLMEDVGLAQTGGIALNLQGGSERWIFREVDINQARWPILTEGDTNENYFDRVNVINSGGVEGKWCWSVNCPGGRDPRPASTWLPDPHSAVYLDGDNVHFMNSSIKSTVILGGLRMSPTTSSVSHVYFEGYPWGGQPRVNHAIAIGGKQELGHLTTAIAADARQIPVDDAGWQPLYVNNPADVEYNGEHAYTPMFGIYPADYQPGSTEASRAVPGISRGTMEWVSVFSFAGDGRAYIRRRGVNGTRAIAWPAGSIIEQVPSGGYGQQWIEESHFNSVTADASQGNTAGCDDTAQRTHWTSSPSLLCAELLVGYVPDGYGVPFPGKDVHNPSFNVVLAGNSIYFDEKREVSGAGWLKVAAAATVTLLEGDPFLRSMPSAPGVFTTYSNATHVQAIQYPSGLASMELHDLDAHVDLNTQDRFLSAEVRDGKSLAHVYTGEQCWYPLAAGNAQPTSRFCIRPGGAAQETLVNNAWVPARLSRP